MLIGIVPSGLGDAWSLEDVCGGLAVGKHRMGTRQIRRWTKPNGVSCSIRRRGRGREKAIGPPCLCDKPRRWRRPKVVVASKTGFVRDDVKAERWVPWGAKNTTLTLHLKADRPSRPAPWHCGPEELGRCSLASCRTV